VISIATVALLATQAAPPDHSTVLLPGLLFSAGNQGAGIGGEVSLVHWPYYRSASIFGVYGQGEIATRASRVGAGFEAGTSALGLELGWSHRFANDDHSATHFVHVGPYLSLALMSLGLRVGVPVGGDDRAWGTDVAFTLTVKGFKLLSGHEPEPINMNMPHGRPVRDARGNAIEPPYATGPALLHLAAGEWIARGRQEQASVATFLRLARELAQHDAPQDLIDDCHRAALDEIAHARFCFAMAERVSGARVFPSDLVVPPPRQIDLATLAAECLVDGVDGEGRSADALEREGLHEMAREERSHAELAARIVAFATDRRTDTTRAS